MIRLDALVGQHVVHQHQFAIVEPDFPAVSLLWWRVIAPCCQSQKETIRKSGNKSGKKERNQFYRTHSPYLIFQAWNSNSSREMLAQLATARAATAAISSSFILIDSTSRNGKEILCDLQETTQVDVNCFTSTSLLKSHDVGCHMHATTGSALFLSFFNLKPLKLFPISSVCFFFVSMHMQ